MTADCQKSQVSLSLSVLSRARAIATLLKIAYYLRAVDRRSLRFPCRNQRHSAEGRMTLSGFILLPTFMCISQHDRRDNRARCIIVNVSQFWLRYVLVLASRCRLRFRNHRYDVYHER